MVKDVKALKDKGYVLIQTSRKVVESEPTAEILEKKIDLKEKIEFIGTLAEIDLKNKRVSRIENIAPQIIPLTEKEKEKAKKVAENNPKLREIVPLGAKIKEIVPLPHFSIKIN